VTDVTQASDFYWERRAVSAATRANSASYPARGGRHSDFYWDRESGMRINIGIHGVRLIAEFDDVDRRFHRDLTNTNNTNR